MPNSAAISSVRCARGGAGRNPRERVDSVFLDEAEPEGVGVGNDGDLPVPVVGRSQGRRLEAAGVQVG